jgi:serine/threonine protein kinase/Flp pilus assembly protein TadD
MIGRTLGHYSIVSKLGEGGMGAVYRATDTTLGRDVALKVLPPDVASDPERLERFRREARAVATLNHPNIVTIYSVEQAGGVPFLTMELVTGAPLDRLIGAQPLPIARVIEIAVSLADALAAAHERGIVHRDLKPANVMLTGSGRVKVLDFGLAKISSDPTVSGADAPTNLATSAGTVLGTPAYMSPEQVSGVGVDHRTDIFSLGTLLYELATGVRPFRGASPAELASSILRDEPARASEIRPLVPPALASVIARCLEKHAVMRYATMDDVLKALKTEPAPAPAVAIGPSVAVLPFQNLSADPENEFFSDGLAEEILNALSQIDGLHVAARASSFSFKGRTSELAEIGSKLRVATVLDGSVRRAGQRVRVTVQLVDVANGFQLWSERYDRQMADIFDVQDEIARAIADKLKVTLTAAHGSRIIKQATANVEAYDLYLRGRALLLRRGRHVAEGIECLRRAVDLDPKFAAAWAGLADSYTVRGYWGMAVPGDVMPKGLTAARRAVALDPDLAEGHSALAMSLLLWERDYDGARAAFERCLELNPGYVQGRCWYGAFYLSWLCGRTADGVAEVRRALDMDPLSAYAMGLLAMCLFCDGRNEEALDLARRAAERDPDSLFPHWVHQMAAALNGQIDESVDAARRMEAVSAGHSYAFVNAAIAYAEAGRWPEARAEYARVLELAARKYVPCSMLASAAAAIGESDRAIELAHQACDERDGALLILFRVFPTARKLRADPRFADVVRRLRVRDLPQ